MSAHEIDIDHHVKVYMRVFAALAVLTVLTVWIASLHFTTAGAVALALFIATVKGSLVACYFMHLISEKKLIYVVLVVAALFFFFELLLPTISESDNIHREPAVVSHEG
jgi:cytochrome c oxidase subunit 4